MTRPPILEVHLILDMPGGELAEVDATLVDDEPLPEFCASLMAKTGATRVVVVSNEDRSFIFDTN